MSKLVKTEVFVLRSLPYSESSLISLFFTRELGVRSYIQGGVRGKIGKSGIQIAHLQPGTILEAIVYDNQNTDLNRIKEVRTLFSLQSQPFHPKKTAVLLFACELLRICLNPSEPHPRLFDRLKHEIETLLLNLMEPSDFVFDLLYEIAFESGFWPEEPLELFRELSLSNFPLYPTDKELLERWYAHQNISNSELKRLLKLLMALFELHISTFKEMKTLDVLSSLGL